MITTIEELSINAWPALQTLLYDGWVLRFANGYTRRANSINPLYPGGQDIQEKVAFCEQLYRSQGLPVVYKITAESHPTGLDAVLQAHGYLEDAHTSVQLLDLNTFSAGSAPDVHLTTGKPDAWLPDYFRISELSHERQMTLRQMLQLLLPNTCFASVQVNGQVAACGMGVYQAGFIGLYDIITDVKLRRQGYGYQLIQQILAWGKDQGAHMAYLQVMLNNPPALNLYARLGFVETYRYWYRVKA
jgi:N-acetylglutamate synthase